jgi:hypothetical protein
MLKRNLGLGEFVDNRKELVGEMMDWEAEAKRLREKLARENNVEEYVDYDDEYLEGKLDDGMKEDSKQEINSQKKQKYRQKQTSLITVVVTTNRAALNLQGNVADHHLSPNLLNQLPQSANFTLLNVLSNQSPNLASCS